MIGLGSEPIIGSSEEASRRGTWQQQIGGSGMLAAGNDWDTRRPYTLSWKPCQGDSLNLPDHRIHKDGDGDASFQLESDSLPHAHAQTTKTYYKHQDSRIMKA
ncbi:hypothetical protein Tco_0838105 [Tanacetum coccineum]|uniref:Uncharacterized protein n=1 Tax=Tanacetum coccineum TaxID=301880 RepID=A0ABQ5AQV6_9ASTR